MDKLSGISSISKNLFRPKAKASENTCQNQSNPFGVSFKGKIYTADVFEKAKSQTNLKVSEKIANRSKLISSAVVGSINNFASNISARLNTIASFGRRIKQNVSNTWNDARNSKIETLLRADVKDIINSLVESKQNLAQKPVSELEEMLTTSISAMSPEVK